MTARAATRRLARAALAALLTLSGCTLLFGPDQVPTKFFVLDAVAPAAGVASHLVIGLGPISLPEYLDRPELAARVDANEITYSQTARWAEPVKQNFVRTLGGDLIQLLGPDRLETWPWYSTVHIDYAVAVDLDRFELQRDGTVMLIGRWTVRDGSGRTLASRTAILSRPGGSDEQIVASLSQLVADLAQEIAAVIRP